MTTINNMLFWMCVVICTLSPFIVSHYVKILGKIANIERRAECGGLYDTQTGYKIIPTTTFAQCVKYPPDELFYSIVMGPFSTSYTFPYMIFITITFIDHICTITKKN